MLSLINTVSNWVWGPITIVLLVGTGIYLTFRMGFIQFRGLPHAIQLIRGKYDRPEDTGEITHFQALSTALSATIGVGNIAGVATAIAAGGPGAVFWMWVTAVFGSALKFTSCTLSLKFREIKKDGHIAGGPMYYIEKGLNLKPLAVIFAFCGAVAAFGIGNMVQSNTVADALRSSFSIPTWLTGGVVSFLVALVIIGGIKRIARVAERLTPFMTVFYITVAMVIIFTNLGRIPEAFFLILKHAFTPTAATGGFLGSTVAYTLRMGVARGIFSNESGLGSAPIAHAAAKTEEPVREGLVAMVGPFIDTIIVCSMTALVIILTGVWSSGETGAPLTALGFSRGFIVPRVGEYIVTLGVALFAFSTMLGWSYYGEKCAEYLLGEGIIFPYRWFFVFFLFLGALFKLPLVWGLSDIANGLMAFPNLIALIFLSPLVSNLVRDYFSRWR
jgi:AGCS family alanine or glycine:cation symporter